MKLIQSNDRLIQQFQSNVKEVLEPIASNLITQGHFIKNVTLNSGSNIIATGLNQNLNGWLITRLRSSASIYDNQDNNTTPSQNLILISSADVIIDIYVF